MAIVVMCERNNNNNEINEKLMKENMCVIEKMTIMKAIMKMIIMKSNNSNNNVWKANEMTMKKAIWRNNQYVWKWR